MSETLATLGGVLKILGLIVTAVGLMRTWHDFPPGERFLEPLVGRVVRTARRAISRVRSVFARWRGRRPSIPVEGHGAISFGGALEAHGVAGYGPLSPGPPEDSITTLDARTREIMARINSVAERLEAAIADLRDAAAKRDEEVKRRLDDLNRRDVRIATGGIRIAALGLLMIGLGELAQLIAPLLT